MYVELWQCKIPQVKFIVYSRRMPTLNYQTPLKGCLCNCIKVLEKKEFCVIVLKIKSLAKKEFVPFKCPIKKIRKYFFCLNCTLLKCLFAILKISLCWMPRCTYFCPENNFIICILVSSLNPDISLIWTHLTQSLAIFLWPSAQFSTVLSSILIICLC